MTGEIIYRKYTFRLFWWNHISILFLFWKTCKLSESSSFLILLSEIRLYELLHYFQKYLEMLYCVVFCTYNGICTDTYYMYCTYTGTQGHIVVDSAVSCILLYSLSFLVFKAYEKQKQMQKSTTRHQSKSEEREKVEKFKTTENSIVSKPINPFMFGNYLLILKVALFT